MLKKNKLKVILSSIIILLPVFYGILVWNELPDMLTTHWGADGNADGVSGKVFAVFGFGSDARFAPNDGDEIIEIETQEDRD